MNYTEYNQILNDTHNTLDDISLKMKKYLPRYLYRYRSFGTKYWEKEIFKGQIYLATAKELNDPMDCLLYFDFSKLPKDCNMIKKITEQWKNLGITYEEIIELFKDQKKQEQLFDDLREDVRIASFSEDHKLILMWSHYTNKHEGFCIRYRTDQLGNIMRNKFFPILYSKNKPDVFNDIKDCTNNAMIKSFVYKAEEWDYEKEWRVLVPSSKQNMFYQEKAIDTIYLGAKCAESNKSQVVKWARENGKKVVQMKVNLKKYELVEDQLV